MAVSRVWPAAISMKEETRVSFSAAVGGSPAMAAKVASTRFFTRSPAGGLVSRVRWAWDLGGWVWEVRKREVEESVRACGVMKTTSRRRMDEFFVTTKK